MVHRVFLILPIGVESVSLRRWPVVSAALAAVMVVLFLVTWVFAPSHEPDVSRIRPALSYWEEHPYLELDPRLQEGLNLTADQIAEWRASLDVTAPRDEVTLSTEQAELDRVSIVAIEELESVNGSLLRRLSLVPDRGVLQAGWITSLFVHFGWFHLLGNLLFFYLSALLLEDRWGRPLFVGFYLLGGVAANVSQALVMDDGSIPILGASGAIAACMGAFAVNMPRVRIRIGYFLFMFRVFTGTFGMAAWVAGLLWFGRELLSLAGDDGTSGVAFMAHVGGFAFGAAIAAAFRAFGFERTVLQKHVEGVESQARPEVADAMEHLDSGEPQKALAVLDRALKKSPSDAELQNARAIVLIRLDRSDEAGRSVRTLILRALTANDAEELRRLIEVFGTIIEPTQFSAAQALRLGQVVSEGQEKLDFAEQLLVHAMSGPPTVRAPAILRAARLQLQRGRRPDQVLELLDQLGPSDSLDAHLREQRESLETEIRSTRGFGRRAISLELEVPLPGSVSSAKLVSLGEEGLNLEIDGSASTTVLPWTGIQQICVAHLARLDGRTNVLVIDFVIGKDGAGPTVLRLPSHRLALQALYPDQPPLAAWQKLVAELLRRSGTKLLRLQQAALPKFDDAASFEAAAYGNALLRASA